MSVGATTGSSPRPPRPASILAQADHRPWALPTRPWAMAMTWRHLLFAHWRIDAGILRPLIPRRLDVDTYDGSAWIGLVPFTMTGIRAPFTPALPWFGAFHELNVRTYVTDPGAKAKGAEANGKPGVWFLSLDAENPVAVEVARRTFSLNYLHARMTLRETEDGVVYTSRRTDTRATGPERGARLDATYSPTEPSRPPQDGMERWLIERYCLYSASTSVTPDQEERVYRGDIHHVPWSIARAEWSVRSNTMLSRFEGALEGAAGDDPLLHYAERIDTLAWLPERLGPLERAERGEARAHAN